MASTNKEIVVYCFDTLVAHYNSEQAPTPAFDDGQQKTCRRDHSTVMQRILNFRLRCLGL
ncbi:hypothetical protein ACSBR2_022287 [Camellia fascicularis]